MTTGNMNTITANNYGEADVLKMTTAQLPSPKANEVLVRNYATDVTAADIMMRTGKPRIGRLYLGLTKPKHPVLGFDFAGEVVATGQDVSTFSVGDRVFGGTTALGCYAEFVCVNVNDVIARIPENSSFEEVAPVASSAITVINFLKGLGQIKANDRVLINGASGSLGTYAVQYAKYVGAEVTGVCSTANLEMVKGIGADFVIDYTKTNFTQNGKRYDIIFDTVGKRSFSECRKVLSPNGIYLSSVIGLPLLLRSLMQVFGRQKARFSATGALPAKKRLAYLNEINTIMATGKLKSVIDRKYTLEELAEAHRYVESGHKKGNVVIVI
ncbi:MAG: Zn-dependent oxidoreductase [Candidatus Fluviicola riflensis]|nr:MAG: Zn-dependent oxidoreductase [Candidatus Fluviicola riflensis]OGS82400.1 MAG: Zn-dependent oxidoreductase [Fluviicola sp. RIFCSPHIGHO2_01_FULL_43_53]OGS88064.1 MAG: Zn-dependent oxidoreductase [Fluviicola sp. RIFCSPHIGHO2_12_FULL_43_24]